MNRRGVAPGIALLVCTGCGHADRAPGPFQVDLRGSEESVLGDLRGIERVIELSDASLVAAERYDYRFVRIDPHGRAVRRVGRRGRGPGEFEGEPRPIIHLQGDTVAIWEGNSRRFSIFRDTGFVRLEHPPSGHLDRGLSWVDATMHADSTGTIYVGFLNRFHRAPGEPDTFPVLRAAQKDWTLDTVWLQPVPPVYRHPMRGKKDSWVGGGKKLGPTNYFGVSRDGRMWSVLTDQQRLVVGKSMADAHQGPPWGLEPRPVTQRDRDSVYDRWEFHPAYGLAEWQFAEERAVITDAIISPYGAAWLRLDQTAQRGATTYRVFDGEGVARYQILFPAGTTIVGFGTEAIYTIREDEDGLETLYRVPRIEGMPAPGEFPPLASAPGSGSGP